MNQKLIRTASILGASGIMLGAMAAHALDGTIDPEKLEAFKTGTRYQNYHAIAMLALVGISSYIQAGKMKWVYRSMTWGVILFSGSIYLLSTAPIFNMSLKFLGPVTPLGGLLMILSWILLLFSLKKPD